MKILCCGDLHAREKAPVCRIDDFFQTFLFKLNWIINMAIDREVEAVVFPGDVFDTFRASDFLKKTLIERLSNVLVVSGQHDQRHHSLDLSNTPLGVLEAAGAVNILSSREYIMLLDEVSFYGSSWGEDIPEIKDKGRFNILVTHQMIIKDDLLWSGQESFSRAKNLLRTTGFDLIISGDNHQFFMENVGDKWLINCGSLMRQSIDQADHRPAVVLFDTKTRKPEIIYVPIKPSAEVMSLNEKEREVEKNEKLERYKEGLRSDSEYEGVDFVSNLGEYMKKEKIEKGVCDVIWEAVPGRN